MRASLTLLAIIIFPSVALAQSNAELDTLYRHGKYAQALKMAGELMTADTTNAFAYGISGAVYQEQGKGNEATLLLEKAIRLDQDKNEISGWSHARLGTIYVRAGLKDKGISELRTAVALNKTEAQEKYAQYLLADVLITNQQYAEAATLAKAVIAKDTSYAQAYLSLGSIYFYTKVYDSAAYNFRRAIAFNKDRSWVSSWSHAHLAEIYIHNNKKDSAIEELTKTVDLGHTKPSVKFAEHLLDSLGAELSKEEPNWTVIESEHMIFNFQDTTGWGPAVNTFMKKHDSAYVVNNETFHAVLPKKITYKVWNDKGMAKRVTGRELGFTRPGQCLSHVSRNQSIGHEITHTLSYWGWGQKQVGYAKFISEGAAVAFNLTGNEQEKYAEAKAILHGSSFHSVLDIWDNDKTDEKILYPVGGAFVTFLNTKCSAEEFKIIVLYQTSSSARNMLGEERFNKVIKEFNELMGLQ